VDETEPVQDRAEPVVRDEPGTGRVERELWARHVRDDAVEERVDSVTPATDFLCSRAGNFALGLI